MIINKRTFLICCECGFEWPAIRARKCKDGKFRCKKCSHNIASRKYKKTDKGKASEKRYQLGDAFRATQVRHRRTDKYRETRKKIYRIDIEKSRRCSRQRRQKYYWADPEYYRMKSIASNHSTTSDILQKILDRDKICQLCGNTDNLTFDHMHPVSKGGKSKKNNLQVLCRGCNSFKQDRLLTPIPFAGVLINA